MNEKFMELADQLKWESDVSYGELMRYAELIVRECMDIVSDESEKVSDEWRCKDGQHIWWKIKEHFGVK